MAQVVECLLEAWGSEFNSPILQKEKKILSSSFFEIYCKLFVSEYKKKELNAWWIELGKW
jgi:hypothetical protein